MIAPDLRLSTVVAVAQRPAIGVRRASDAIVGTLITQLSCALLSNKTAQIRRRRWHALCRLNPRNISIGRPVGSAAGPATAGAAHAGGNRDRGHCSRALACPRRSGSEMAAIPWRARWARSDQVRGWAAALRVPSAKGQSTAMDAAPAELISALIRVPGPASVKSLEQAGMGHAAVEGITAPLHPLAAPRRRNIPPWGSFRR